MHEPTHVTRLAIPVLLYLCLCASAAEYTVLVVPWLVLSNRWRAYSWTAFAAVLCIYLLFHGGMLFAPWWHSCVWEWTDDARQIVAAITGLTALAFWLVCGWTVWREL